MLRRILMLLMIVLLLLTLSASAEDLYNQIDAALYRLILRTEAGDQSVGSGVLFSDASVLLTAEGCCKEGALYAVSPTGEHAVKSCRILEGGIALLELAAPVSAQPLTLAPENVQSMPFLFGANTNGERGSMPLYGARADMSGGLRGLLFSSEEGLLPGAFLTDQEGRITALITGQRAEGIGHYTALGAASLNRVLSLSEPTSGTFLPIAFSWEDGQMTVSWTDQERTSGVYIITLLCDENKYYTTYETAVTERSLTLTPPPGHTYSVQVEHAVSDAESLPPNRTVIRDYTLPLLSLTAYGIQADCAILSVPAGADVTGEEAALTEFPATALTAPGRDLLLSVRASYDISAATDAVLTLELVSPGGQFYFDEQTISLDPAKADNDHFVLPLDDLLASCARFSGGTIQAGDHTVRFFLDGCLAGEYTFCVTEGDDTSAVTDPAAAAVAEGFVSGLSAKAENGAVTLSWDASAIPEGAKVRAYYLYGSNPYFIFHEPAAGADSTVFFTIPGYSAIAWVAWSANGDFTPALPLQYPDKYVLVNAAAESPMTAHSFRNVRIGLAPSADPKAGSSKDFLPQVPITREMLSDRSTPLYFMTEDTYLIGATSEEHPLVIVLVTPDRLCFADMGYYVFDRSLQSSDLWLKDISRLFAEYEAFCGGNAWPAGEYRLLYCIDGQVAGEFPFTLE